MSNGDKELEVVYKQSKNGKLNKARKAKNDEFYTRLCDIENELRHYEEHFKDKIVLCNCDDPTWSSFWKYFHMNFSRLGLKKLIGTHYETKKPNSYAVEYEGGDDGNTDFYSKYIELKGDGDFSSEECLEYLKECDIVVTNPPFSLFRKFIGLITSYPINFIVVGDLNSITYKEVFPLIREGKIWSGYCHPKEFNTSSNGDETRKFGNKMWFTNLKIKKRYEELILYRTYNPIDYLKYDNYNAINIDKVADIPIDYNGVMGVPITFLDKYNPNQFEILGCSESEGLGFSNGLWLDNLIVKQPLVNGERKYKRLFIRRK